ncbi:MAG: acyl-CoA dehydrogenase family protein [Acidimicrobiia bacterium]
MSHLSDDERIELRDAARRLLVDRSSSGRVRELLDDPDGFDRSLWSSMAELGWPAIHIPAELGGMGASYADLAVILHELGRQVTPSPLVPSALVGGSALIGATNADLASELLPDVAAGERLLAVALTGVGGSYDPHQLSVRWAAGSGSVTVNGAARFVLDAHVADHLVVAATEDEGRVTLAVVDRLAPGVHVAVEPTIDRTRRLATVTLDDVTVPDARLLTEPGAATDLHGRIAAIGAIAMVCDAVGAAERILEIATDYAKQRFQFGRPIGSFQAVKHHLANMFTDVEASRAAAVHAVDVLDDGGDVRHAAAIAKSFAGPACARVASLAIQVHGGIGFTWEHDAHLFLKRAKLDEAMFGSPRRHRQHLASLLIDEQLAI